MFNYSMPNAFVQRLTLIGLTFLLVACSGGTGDQPSEDDIGKAIAFNLPGGMRVADVEVIVSDNEGSAVEPLIRTRAKVVLEFADDFVVEQHRYDDRYVLKKIYDEGQTIVGIVITSGRLKGELWNVTVDRSDFPKIQGSALGRYIEGSYAFEGTEAASRFIAEHEAKVAAAEKAQREAKEKRLAEVRAAKEKAEKEKAERIASFREFLAGTWVSKSPVMDNGKLFLSRNTRKTAGIELAFPEGGAATGVVRASVYVTDNPADVLTVEGGFTVSDDGRMATLKLRSKAHNTLGFYFGRETWALDASGMLKTIGRDSWFTQLEKDGPALAAKKQLVARIAAKDKAIEKLVLKHKAALNPGTFGNARLQDNTYYHFFVEAIKNPNGNLYGDGRYSYGSSISNAAIHSGVLKEGEAGILKITKHRLNSRVNFPGTISNDLTSESFQNRDYYSIQLVEKLSEY